MKSPVAHRSPRCSACALLLITLLPASAELEDGLVAYWPLDGDLLDQTATGAHGTFDSGTGVPTLSFLSGKFGTGIDLNNFDVGSFDQYVEIDGVPESTFDFAGGSMSFSLWARSPFLGVESQALLAKGDGASWRLTKNGAEAGPAFRAGALSATGDSLLYPLADDAFHHYVGIAEDGVGLSLYRDGILIAEAPGDPNIANSANNLMLGGNPDASADFFRTWEGVIDDVGIWNRALTPAEVGLLWNNGTGIPVGEATNPSDTDDDGMPDFYENNTAGLDPNNPADASQGADDGLFDNDGLTNLEEYNLGSNPNLADTDGDGLDDGDEVSGARNPFSSAPTAVLDADTDHDGLSDGEEVTGSRNPLANDPTDPNKADTDGDGASDLQEIAFGFDPNNPASAPPPLQRGLKGFWSFDNSLEDGSGLGFHGTFLGNPATPSYPPGKRGRAILLDGRSGFNQSVQISGSETAFDFPGGSTTVSAWVRFSFAPSAEPTVVAKGGTSNWRLALDSTVVLGTNAGSNELRFAAGPGFLQGGGSIQGPQWHHAVGVADAGQSTRLYVDGLLVATGPAPMLGSSGLPAEIGGNPEVFDRNWSGLIDEVAVWDRALSPGEIRQLWNDGDGASMGALVVGLDTDHDAMSDLYETAHGLDPNADDSDLDPDGDGLSNLEEHDFGSSPQDADTDADGLNDRDESLNGTNPLGRDTDGDGLSDGEEVSGSLNAFLNNGRRDPFTPGVDPPGDPTDPLSPHSDSDIWTDYQEVGAGSNPNDGLDVPRVTQIVVRGGGTPGAGTGALLGGDLTDPENNGIDGSMMNWNWVSITASSKPSWTGQGAFNVFDNQVNTGDAKWCCNGPPQNVTVEFAQAYALTHFTLASGNDVPERDPTYWSIQGSNDGLQWEVIYPDPGFRPGPGRSLWTQRYQVLRFNLPKPSKPYRFFRYDCRATVGGTEHQINELELFGFVPTTPDEAVAITSAVFAGTEFRVSATGLDPATSYVLRRSADGTSFLPVGSPVTGTSQHTFVDPTPAGDTSLYQIWTTAP